MVNVEAGDVICLGRFPQSDDPSADAEPIEWIVLDTDRKKAMLISRYGLAAKTFDEMGGIVTWDNCTLRAWLNSSFYDSAFTDEERSHLETVDVPAEYSPYGSVDPGDDTQDKVFLLSVDESARYFSNDSARICLPVKKAVKNGAWVRKEPGKGCGACRWWLRTPGALPNFAAIVDTDGSIDTDGVYVDLRSLTDQQFAVRPVVLLRLNG